MNIIPAAPGFTHTDINGVERPIIAWRVYFIPGSEDEGGRVVVEPITPEGIPTLNRSDTITDPNGVYWNRVQ